MRGKLRAGILSTVALFSLAFAPAAAHNRSRPTQDCHEWTGVAAALLVSDFVLGRAAVGGGEPAPRRPPGAPRPRIVPRTLRSRARPRPPPPAARRGTRLAGARRAARRGAHAGASSAAIRAQSIPSMIPSRPKSSKIYELACASINPTLAAGATRSDALHAQEG